jgi:hypothetical protein
MSPGFTIDDWLGYSSKKITFIRDRKLGLIYYGLVLAVLLYIFGVQILRNNEQFNLASVTGIPRIYVSHPTVNNCDSRVASCKSDYRSLEELPYCNEYTGNSPAMRQSSCRFQDLTSIMPYGDVDNKIFIPTAIQIMTEKRNCKPSPENDYTCDNEYELLPGSDCLVGDYMCQTRGGETGQFYYVADTKNFAVQLTSSYEQGDVHGTSLDHAAFYEICPARVRGANETHHWRERLEHSETSHDQCAEGQVKVVPMPCAEGVECSQRENFDLLNATGLEKTIKRFERVRDAVHKRNPFRSSSSRSNNKADLTRDNTGEEDVDLDEISFQEIGKEGSAKARQRKFKKASARHPHRAAPTSFLHEKQHPIIKTHMLDITDEEAHSDAHARAPQIGSKKQIENAWDPKNRDQLAAAHGDIFKLKRLMELAGADLDYSFNQDMWSTRESGTVIEVSVIYENLHPWISSFGYKDVNYRYRVKELPLPYVSRTNLAVEQPADYPETRRYEVQHGIMIWFKVSGHFGNFDKTYFLIYLVTAFALIGVATTITDLIAIYLHNRRANYFKLKYDVSEHFDGKWECEECGFLNSKEDTECQNYALWCHPNDDGLERCGKTKRRERESDEMNWARRNLPFSSYMVRASSTASSSP